MAEDGAIHNPGEGWGNMPDFIPALVAEAAANGARVIEHAGDVRVDVRVDVQDGAALV